MGVGADDRGGEFRIVLEGDALIFPFEQRRVGAVERLLFLRDRRLRQRQDPLRRALEEAELCDLVDHRADDLRRGRAGADDADALAFKHDLVLPARGVESFAGEIVQTRNIRHDRVMQDAGRRDHRVEGAPRALRCFEMPLAVAPVGARDLLAVADRGLGVMLARDLFQIVENFRARRADAAPFGIGFEGIAIAVRRHVAGDARIAVVAPGAAQRVGLLVDRHILDAGLAQLDQRHQAGGAGADDRDAEISFPGHAIRPSVRFAAPARFGFGGPHPRGQIFLSPRPACSKAGISSFPRPGRQRL